MEHTHPIKQQFDTSVVDTPVHKGMKHEVASNLVSKHLSRTQRGTYCLVSIKALGLLLVLKLLALLSRSLALPLSNFLSQLVTWSPKVPFHLCWI